MLVLLEDKYLPTYIIWNSSAWEICLSSLFNLFNHLFVSHLYGLMDIFAHFGL